MKNSVIKLVWLTTCFVFIFAGLCQANTAITLLISLFIIGYFLILFTIYTVLKDNYSTKKTFKDWYEDYPSESLND